MPQTVIFKLAPSRLVWNLAICYLATLSASLAAECQPPKYKTGYVWEKTPSSIMMNISIPMADFAPSRLVCLAGALRRRYAGFENILILVYSSHQAASKHRSPRIGDTYKSVPNWGAQNHAVYVYDAQKNEEEVSIRPIGTDRSSSVNLPNLSTDIRLPASVLPPCTLEIAHRCLLALDEPNYQEDLLRGKISGSVTLEGVIDRTGRIRNINPVSPGDRMLADAATGNLQTWRFESSAHADPVKIAFSYTLDPSEPAFAVSVRFELPDKVDIRAGFPQ